MLKLRYMWSFAVVCLCELGKIFIHILLLGCKCSCIYIYLFNIYLFFNQVGPIGGPGFIHHAVLNEL